MESTLLAALQGTPEDVERAFAYSPRARKFNAKNDIMISKVGMALMAAAMWGIFFMGIARRGSEYLASPGMLALVLVAAAFTAFAVYTWVFYSRELGSLGEHLEDTIITRGPDLFIQSGPDRHPAQFVSLKKGSFMIYDMGSRLNTWRLHVLVDGQSRFYDPSKMPLHTWPTPYPR